MADVFQSSRRLRLLRMTNLVNNLVPVPKLLPSRMKGQGNRCVRKVEEIGPLEYRNGKLAEADNPRLQVRKPSRRVRAAC